MILSEISVIELHYLNQANVIDIRSAYDYSNGHIDGAINIPYYNLLNNYSHYLSKYSLYYIYCDFGEQSREISKRLNCFGYNTINIIGGYQEYKKFLEKN